jgi:hypothetical protein
LTEHLHLWVSPQRCTHQSIDQVGIVFRSVRIGARTPPPTLLFPSQQCQRAKFHPRRDRKRTSQTPEHLAALRKPEAPRRQFVRTAPPMKMFYPNPFFRSTSISNFFRNHCHPAPLLSIQTSFSIRKARICLCVYLIQINDIDPTSFCFPSEEPLVIARY